MKHSVHHTVLLEIHRLTERYTAIVTGDTKDLYRSSNNFSTIARLLGLGLQPDTGTSCRENGEVADQKDQVKIQDFEEELEEKVVQLDTKSDSPGPQTCHSPSQETHDQCQDTVFNRWYPSPLPAISVPFDRSKNLALHTVQSSSTNPDLIQDREAGLNTEDYLIEATLCTEPGPARSSAQDNHYDSSSHKGEVEIDIVDTRERDQLWKHFRENLKKIRTFCADMVPQIPIPEHCIIEDTQQGCVAQLSFSCPMKGHYCLYGKSCFSLCSGQPHLWIRIMLLALQSKMGEPLSSDDVGVKQLRRLWEKMQLKGSHSFELAMTQTAVPHQKDLDSLQIHLEEVRFFDLFSYSMEDEAWLCFMCKNPEKAAVVNKDGQPFIEGLLKEKQVRWRFIKRWKTRYFTLAGNQLLFRKEKSIDEPDDHTIELSKVQSVKVVAKKRRGRDQPRAFKIFTDNKRYVLKAEDQKHAEEWLQCINVAVAQAKERENREATTYL
ncbi:Ventricular zone-expressed PH domain-containing protein [Bagarius yarrelli]|uniref:Ventricular zone-expressed PH domain-containing protein n=1 Tax=Bagarius yarrelli TaxID=175774 RepID=A0A556TQG6_BAGYA|nr:Ventricular zone-expressed PH domain-containing protein [Bagarius yarrelli]